MDTSATTHSMDSSAPQVGPTASNANSANKVNASPKNKTRSERESVLSNIDPEARDVLDCTRVSSFGSEWGVDVVQ
jgi:hypothetical protein